VFVEKPLCLAPAEGEEMVAAADDAGVTLMVGYHKRYDAAFERAAEEVRSLSMPLLARLTTLEGPIEPTIAPYRIRRPEPLAPDVAAELAHADGARVAEALPDADPTVRRVYREYLLDSMVHELNAIRALLGGPLDLRYASIRGDGEGVVAVLGLPNDVDCTATWTSLPVLDRYEQQIAIYAPERRLLLRFPSPFLRNAPTLLEIEAGDERGATWHTTVTASWEEAFLRELVQFHRSATTGERPPTDGRDALADIRLVRDIALLAARERELAAVAAPHAEGARL
jgi:predicted dehydrogenase